MSLTSSSYIILTSCFIFLCYTIIYLFLPTDDETYMSDDEKREEYVLADVGKVGAKSVFFLRILRKKINIISAIADGECY